MSDQRDRMIQDFRGLLDLPRTRGRANMAANSACAYLIDLQDSTEEQRRAALKVIRVCDSHTNGGVTPLGDYYAALRKFAQVV